jgi:hypothetical protein
MLLILESVFQREKLPKRDPFDRDSIQWEFDSNSSSARADSLPVDKKRHYQKINFRPN